VVAPRPVTTTLRRESALLVDADKSVPICTYALDCVARADGADGAPGRVLGSAAA